MKVGILKAFANRVSILCSYDLLFLEYMNSQPLNSSSDTCRLLLGLNQPLRADAVLLNSEPLLLPRSIARQLSDHWHKQLKLKQEALRLSGVRSIIKPFAHTVHDMSEALFVDDKAVMWPGSAITLRAAQVEDDKLRMQVSEVSYPLIGALGDPEFRKAIHDAGLTLIRPPLAYCTFAITSDHFMVLTKRGVTTNVYPGRYYGQGGNPASMDVSVAEHQLDEMKDEILADRDEVDEASFRFYGLVEDLEEYPGKPDLIGSVRLRITASRLQFRMQSRPASSRPPDAADIRMIPFNKDAMQDFVLHTTSAKDYCPPAFGGLQLLMQHEFGSR